MKHACLPVSALGSLVAASAAFLSTGCAATSGGGATPAVQGFENSDGLFFYSAGIDALLVDEKDAGLLRALHLLEERLSEIPAEVGEGDEVPRDAIALPVRALLGPMSLRAGYNGMDAASQGVAPFYVQFNTTQGSPDEAQAFGGRVAGLLAGKVPPGERGADGLTHIELGGPMVATHGVVGEDFVVALGEVLARPLALGGIGMPAGVEPVLAFKMNFGEYLRVMQDFAGMHGPDGEQMLEMMDMFGAQPFTVEGAVGMGADRSYSTTLMPGYVETLGKTYGMPGRPLSRAAFDMVPADAHWAMLGITDFGALVDVISEVAGAIPDLSRELGGKDPLEFVAELTGIHLRRDIFDHLGDQWGIYLSEATGGGGLGSLVFFGEVLDRDALDQTLAKLAGMANGLADQHAMGYVEVRDWSHEGHEYTSLVFPGLPVPLELTYAFEGDWLIKGLTPQAVIAAVEQAQGGGDGLLKNASFRKLSTGSMDDLYGVSFLNTPALLEGGYGWASFMSSALANGVRSRSDASRGAGLVLPTYQELAKGALPTVSLTRVVDGDMVVTSQGDRSMVVNLTAMLGVLNSVPAVLMLPAMVGAIAGASAQQQAAPFVYEQF